MTPVLREVPVKISLRNSCLYVTLKAPYPQPPEGDTMLCVTGSKGLEPGCTVITLCNIKFFLSRVYFRTVRTHSSTSFKRHRCAGIVSTSNNKIHFQASQFMYLQALLYENFRYYEYTRCGNQASPQRTPG